MISRARFAATTWSWRYDSSAAVSAAVLPAATEQLALVAALGHRADDARTSRLAVPAVLL